MRIRAGRPMPLHAGLNQLPGNVTVAGERYQRRLVPNEPDMTERAGESALPVNAPWRRSWLGSR